MGVNTYNVEEIISKYTSKDPAMSKVYEQVAEYRKESMRGAGHTAVFISGEPGSGKTNIAQSIHATSRFGKGPFVIAHALSNLDGEGGLLKNSLQGSLVIPNVETFQRSFQDRLLECIRGDRARIYFVTTSVSLSKLVEQGSFSKELYQLISAFTIEVPPLRARISDVMPLAQKLAESMYQSRAQKFPGFSKDATDAMKSYSWPGNIRELLYVVARLCAVKKTPSEATWDELTFVGDPKSSASAVKPLGLIGGADLSKGFMDYKKAWSDQFECEYLTAALSRHGGNVSAAAREAKIDRSNFLRLLRRHGLRADPFRKAA